MAERRRAPVVDRAAALPSWARWRPPNGEAWTVGVEEEAMLLDAGTGAPTDRIDEVLAALPPALGGSASAETHASVVELRTRAHPTVGGAVAELAGIRQAVETRVAGLGLRVAAAGMHPLAVPGAREPAATKPRYREIQATMQALAHREPTMALHVHVGVADPDVATRALDGLRTELPALLALSANSPFWRGRDSGFASMRVPVFSMFPRTGIPRPFGTYAGYVRAIERLRRCGAISEPSFVWWDARLQPRLGTVEVRIMDAQSRLGDVAPLAALVQSLVRRHARSRHAPPIDPNVISENRFLAARDGMRAELIAGLTARRSAEALASDLVAACAPFAAELGCARELESVGALAADPGEARQRRVAGVAGVERLPLWLTGEFSPGPVAALAA